MAYFTEITTPRELTESESSQLTSYVSTQVTAGTTNGNIYTWQISASGTQNVRMWSTSESANGYKSIMAGFSPAIPVAVY